jgi:hypothetical protein
MYFMKYTIERPEGTEDSKKSNRQNGRIDDLITAYIAQMGPQEIAGRGVTLESYLQRLMLDAPLTTKELSYARAISPRAGLIAQEVQAYYAHISTINQNPNTEELRQHLAERVGGPLNVEEWKYAQSPALLTLVSQRLMHKKLLSKLV